MADVDLERLDNLTAAEILALQERLAKQLVERQAREKAELVAEIIRLVAVRGYDMSEVLALLSRQIATTTAAYVNPKDPTEIWSGQGRRPRWLTALLESGHSMDDLRASRRLCCTNPVRDSSRESSMVAGGHEQTHTPDLQDQKLA